MSAHPSFSWDGRHPDVASQVLSPLTSPQEQGFSNLQQALDRLQDDPPYRAAFAAAFPAAPLSDTLLAQALAAYLHSLQTAPGAFERYLAGEPAALSVEAQRGYRLFSGVAGCAGCHRLDGQSPQLTDYGFHAVAGAARTLGPRLADTVQRLSRQGPSERFAAIAADAGTASLGRYLVTLDPKDIGRFKTPSLRNVSRTAPYMHDGAIATLPEAIDHEIYYRGRALGRPLILTPQEKADLLAFLRALDAEVLADAAIVAAGPAAGPSHAAAVRTSAVRTSLPACDAVAPKTHRPSSGRPDPTC